MDWTPRQVLVVGAALVGVVACTGHSGATPATGPARPEAAAPPSAAAASPASTSPAASSSPASAAQTPPQGNARLTVECEVFCSAERLRTGNARLRWNVAGPALEGVASLAAVKQNLEVTVYSGGFAKGLAATLPIAAGASPDKPIAALEAPNRPGLRAYQLRVIEVEQPRTLEAVQGGGSTMGVVVEGLEPGMNYTWRLTIETPGGRVVSPEASCEAPVCPADMVPNDAPPVRRP